MGYTQDYHGWSWISSTPATPTCPGYHPASCLHARHGPASREQGVHQACACSLDGLPDVSSAWLSCSIGLEIVQYSLELRGLKMIMSITVLCFRSGGAESWWGLNQAACSAKSFRTLVTDPLIFKDVITHLISHLCETPIKYVKFGRESSLIFLMLKSQLHLCLHIARTSFANKLKSCPFAPETIR